MYRKNFVDLTQLPNVVINVRCALPSSLPISLLARFIVFLYLLVIAHSVYSQQSDADPATAAARQHEQRLQQEQLRQHQQSQSRQRDVDIFLQPEMERSVVEELSGGSCFDVHTVAVEGATQYPKQKIDLLIEGYEQRGLPSESGH